MHGLLKLRCDGSVMQRKVFVHALPCNESSRILFPSPGHYQ